MKNRLKCAFGFHDGYPTGAVPVFAANIYIYFCQRCEIYYVEGHPEFENYSYAALQREVKRVMR